MPSRWFKEQFFSKARVRWVKGLSCSVPGCYSNPCDNAHIRSRGAGGTYRDIIPLCRYHHVEQHTAGIKTFAFKYGLDLKELAKATASAWEAVQHNHIDDEDLAF